MTTTEAAKLIGCSRLQVHTLIACHQLIASVRHLGRREVYDVPLGEVRRYASEPQSKGWPRGRSRKKEN